MRFVWSLILFVAALSTVFPSLGYARDPFSTPWDEESKLNSNIKKTRRTSTSQVFPYSKDRIAQPERPKSISSPDWIKPNQEENQPSRPPLHLMGVIWSEEDGVAIIDGKIYSIGDVVWEDCVLKGIKEGKVLIQCKDQLWKYVVGEGGNEEKDNF